MLTTEDVKKYHVTAERILNALDNSSVPISWHENGQMRITERYRQRIDFN